MELVFDEFKVLKVTDEPPLVVDPDPVLKLLVLPPLLVEMSEVLVRVALLVLATPTELLTVLEALLVELAPVVLLVALREPADAQLMLVSLSLRSLMIAVVPLADPDIAEPDPVLLSAWLSPLEAATAASLVTDASLVLDAFTVLLRFALALLVDENPVVVFPVVAATDPVLKVMSVLLLFNPLPLSINTLPEAPPELTLPLPVLVLAELSPLEALTEALLSNEALLLLVIPAELLTVLEALLLEFAPVMVLLPPNELDVLPDNVIKASLALASLIMVAKPAAVPPLTVPLPVLALAWLLPVSRATLMPLVKSALLVAEIPTLLLTDVLALSVEENPVVIFFDMPIKKEFTIPVASNPLPLAVLISLKKAIAPPLVSLPLPVLLLAWLLPVLPLMLMELSSVALLESETPTELLKVALALSLDWAPVVSLVELKLPIHQLLDWLERFRFKSLANNPKIFKRPDMVVPLPVLALDWLLPVSVEAEVELVRDWELELDWENTLDPVALTVSVELNPVLWLTAEKSAEAYEATARARITTDDVTNFVAMCLICVVMVFFKITKSFFDVIARNAKRSEPQRGNLSNKLRLLRCTSQ